MSTTDTFRGQIETQARAWLESRSSAWLVDHAPPGDNPDRLRSSPSFAAGHRNLLDAERRLRRTRPRGTLQVLPIVP